MSEVIIFLAIAFTGYFFMPANIMSRFFSGKSVKTNLVTDTVTKQKVVVPQDSMLRRHFLTHLRTEVEAEIMAQPIDSALRHYYEASVAAEFQKRLSGMAG